jgi:predicted enzyme involved in methoxymalonyl-ACP biosynthesis
VKKHIQDNPLLFEEKHAAGYFESVSLSPEDLQRAEFYSSNEHRACIQKQAGGLEAYLGKLCAGA